MKRKILRGRFGELKRRFVSILLALALLLSLNVVTALPAAANPVNPLGDVTATPSDYTAGAITDYTIAFTTGTSANISSVDMQFPSGFDVTEVGLGMVSGLGEGTVDFSGQVVTYSVNTTAWVDNGEPISIGLNTIINTQTAGTGYVVTVTTKDGVTTIDGPTASATFEITPDMVAAYTVVPDAGMYVAGSPFDVTITAVDRFGNPLGGSYITDEPYTWSTNASNAPGGTPPSIGSLAGGDFSAGVAVKSVTLYAAEPGVTFTATDSSEISGINDPPITVDPAAAVSIDISPDDDTITADDSQEYLTEATDDYENTFDVTGSTAFSIDLAAGGGWTGGNVYNPGFTGVWTVTGEYDGLSDSTGLTVEPGAVTALTVLTVVDDTVAGEVIGDPVQVEARDDDENVIPGLDITVSLDEGSGTLTGTTPRTTDESGIATFDDLWIDQVGPKGLRFSANGAPHGHAYFDILPGEATSFVFDTIATQNAGADFSITITAKDDYGNVATGYVGPATLSELTATIVPATSGNFTAGVWTDWVTIYLPHESNIITATDGDLTGESNSFTVNPYSVYNITTGQGYLTIQGAIDDASPGDTIEVAPGEYEGYLDIYKSLTLQSVEGPEYTEIDGAVEIGLGWDGEDRLAETVVFDGFRISEQELLIYIKVDNGSSLTISNNILHESIFAIYSGPFTVDNASSVTIEGNYIYYCMTAGIHLEDIVGGSEVIIRDNELFWNGEGIYIDDLLGSTVTIEDNLIAENDDGVVFDDVHESTVIIAGNTIGEGGYSEFLEEWLDGNDCGICFGGEDTVYASTITIGGDTPEEGNVISRNEDFSSGGGICFEADLVGSSVEIMNNYIMFNFCGVDVWYLDEYSTVDIHYNIFYANFGYGIYNDSGYYVDATKNWWGDATGPDNPSNPHGEGASGDAVSSNVEFIPWYVTDTTSPTTENVSVDHPGNSIIALSDTIWGGIDAALAGDTVLVAAGTYNEQVFINKPSLTVQGTDGAEATIIDGTGVTNSSPQPASLVWLQQHHITFEGFTLQNYPQAWVGVNCINGAVIWVQGYDGGLTDGIMGCQVTGNKVNGSPAGIPGILVSGGADSTTISYNEILESGAEGILFSSDADAEANNICYNTITNSSSYGICLRSATPGTVRTFNGNGIYNNEISGGTHGIGIREALSWYLSIEIQRNYIHGVVSGEGEAIEIYDSLGVHVRGNTLEGNGTGIQITDYVFTEDWEECYARYNNISGNTACGVEMVTCTDNFTATHNWWGDASGPYHATTNPTGTGDDVTDKVDYSHWFGAAIADYWSQGTASGNFTVNATDTTDTEVLKEGTGYPAISVVQFTGNPGGSAPAGFAALGKYIDVHIDNPNNVTKIEIRNYYTSADITGVDEATLKLSWWDGTEWIECSDSGATYPAGGPTYRGYVWAAISDNTTPALDSLTGTPFMSMGKTSAPPPLPPGYEGYDLYYLQMNLLGTRQNVATSYDGRLDQTLEATSADGTLTVTIPEGTTARQENGLRLTTFEVSVNENPPPPPENKNIIGLTYNFKPAGATFDPPITLTFTYDPDTLPEGVAEEDLVLAFYDEETGEWVELECTVDTENNIITASVSHFTDFAIIGEVTQPPPPPPAPAAFSISGLSVKPAEVEPGEAVTVSVSVTNTGGTEGSYTVVLSLNGVKEAEKRVTLSAGAGLTVTFSVTREEAGTCTVTVDGLSDSFAVVAPPPPPEEEEELVVVPEEEEEVPPEEEEALIPEPAKPINWPVLGGIIGGVILVIVLITLFWVRRRAY
jgi:nitrous oxidase accessory protein NosD